MGSFADRAVGARVAERAAARLGCRHSARSVGETGVKGLQSALRCLARKDARALPSKPRSWRRSGVNLRGEANAARVWSQLRSKSSGRRALVAAARGRARMIVRAGDRSRVILRAAAGKRRR